MNHLNESEVFNLMDHFGCFDAVPLSKEKCSQLQEVRKRNGYSYQPPIGENSSIVIEPQNIVLTSISFLFYALAILLNCALLLLLYRDPLKRFRNASSFLIFSLAIADLSGACFSLVLDRFSSAEIPSTLSNTVLPWLIVATHQCSFITVVSISLDRYLAIAHPFKYRTMVTSKRTITINVVVWIVSLGLSALLFFIPQIEARSNGTEIYVANNYILIAIILPLYPSIHASFRRQRRQLVSLNSTNKRLRQEKIKTEKNLANTTLLVSLSLFFFTSPYLVVFIFHITNCISCILSKTFQTIWTYYRIFIIFRYGINPIIYAWRLPSYRKSFQKLLSSVYRTVSLAQRRNPPGSLAQRRNPPGSAGPPAPQHNRNRKSIEMTYQGSYTVTRNCLES